MTDEELIKLAKEVEKKERLSRFIRSRLLALELGVQVVAMNFVTGEALIRFDREDAPFVASVGGA